MYSLAALFAAVWWAWTVRGQRAVQELGAMQALGYMYQRDGCEAPAFQERTQGRGMSELSGHRLSGRAWPCVLPVSSAKEVPNVLGRGEQMGSGRM